MPLRKFKNIDGEWLVEIPPEHFRCPDCGAGYETKGGSIGGLYSDDDREELDGDIFYLDEYLRCSADRDDKYNGCNWSGAAKAVYDVAVKKEKLVQCPCCKGTGMTTKEKAAQYKPSKKKPTGKP